MRGSTYIFGFRDLDLDLDLDVFQCAADAKKSSEGFNDKEDPSAGLMNVSILDKRNC